MDRKEFLQRLSLYAVGAITLPALLSFISPNYIDSILVQPNDPRLKSEFINYDSPKGGGSMKGLLSTPKSVIKITWNCCGSRKSRIKSIYRRCWS